MPGAERPVNSQSDWVAGRAIANLTDWLTDGGRVLDRSQTTFLRFASARPARHLGLTNSCVTMARSSAWSRVTEETCGYDNGPGKPAEAPLFGGETAAP